MKTISTAYYEKMAEATVTVDVRDSTSPKTLTTGPNKICDTGIVTRILHLHCIGLNC